tara:strand:+ start:303 stop:1328 length:1026 start_codon:yes stop_codon:yes gene_type:complete
VEACDDGNDVETDACLNDCIVAECGDGFVHEGVEACDDRNEINTDACLNTCEAAQCGDEVVRDNVEECDDGDNDDLDSCTNDCILRLGQSAEAPGTSCSSLLEDGHSLGDGAYFIRPDDGDAFRVYCNMELNEGGWTLAAKLTNQDSRNWADSEARWTDANVYGDTVSMAAGSDAKGAAWGRLSGQNFMLSDNENAGDYLSTNDDCIGGVNLAAYFTVALGDFPGGGDSYYETCAVDRSYFPNWMAEPNWDNQNENSAELSLNHGEYIVIARTDDGNDTSGVVSGYATIKQESDVGLGALESGTEYTNTGVSQDIGGPTSCGYDDAQCRAEYPETVYFWIR